MTDPEALAVAIWVLVSVADIVTTVRAIRRRRARGWSDGEANWLLQQLMKLTGAEGYGWMIIKMIVVGGVGVMFVLFGPIDALWVPILVTGFTAAVNHGRAR